MGMESMGSAASATGCVALFSQPTRAVATHMARIYLMTVIILTIYIDAKVVHSRGTTKKTDKKMESMLPLSVGNTLSITIIIAYVATP